MRTSRARILARSLRSTLSRTCGACWAASRDMWVLHFPHGTYFDRTPLRRGDHARSTQRLVEIVDLEDVVAREPFLGLGVGAVSGQDVAVLHPHGGGHVGRGEGVSTEGLSVTGQLLRECTVVGHQLIPTVIAGLRVILAIPNN